jgi:uncharacterized protein
VKKPRKMNQSSEAGAIPCDNANSSQSPDEFPKELTEPADFSQHGIMKRAKLWVHSTFVQPLVLSKSPPRHDALSVSLGLIIGLIIPVGGQLAALALLRMIMRFNYVIAAAFTLVSNPLNMIPLYYGYYCLGSLVLGKQVSMNFEVFEKLMHPVMDKTYFWEALAAFTDLGCEILVRWTVAAVLLATIFGILGYVVTFRIQEKRCRRAAEGLGIAYEHFLTGLEHEARARKH